MLILFSAENYRSIAEEQTLNMVASKQYDKERDEERKAARELKLIRDKLPGLSNSSYLRTAAVYGSNASGKSTLISAMACMREMVLSSARNSDRSHLTYEPFRFNPSYAEKPTTFFCSFLWGGIRYEYEISYNASTIIDESLYSYPKGLPRKIFTRTAGESEIEIDAPRFKIDKTLISLLNDDCLFLSFVYAHHNFKGYELVKDAGDFFRYGFIILGEQHRMGSGRINTMRILEGSRGTDYQRALIHNMLQEADFGITSAEVRTERRLPKYPGLFSNLDEPSDQSNNEGTDLPPKGVIKRIVFTHTAGDESCEFGLRDESLGTRQLFELSSYIALAYETNATLIVDELDSSLHPLLAINIINLFQSDSSKDKRAQLIFTAHQVAFLMNDLLDRDQIWFTKKKGDGSTELYPLSDYSPRKGEAIWRGYLLGRYEAIPAIPELFGIVPEETGTSDVVKEQ